ncbi:outer membrane protein [Sphingomonas floccifaciens]|uniref:Outer membrane protein n=1 Tax=Sphingomonas floccifaciens TaxID=1844115 RepID=A0ABW4NCR0_9SPHN
MKTILVAAIAAAGVVPSVASAQNFNGPRIEARLGYETPAIAENDSDDIYKIGSAVSYGAEAGYDIRTKRVVVGPYVNYEVSGVKLCDDDICLAERGNFSAGARVGLVAGQRGLVYGKLGYANITLEARDGGSVIDSASKGGIQSALGYEFGLGEFYGFVEAAYSHYGKFDDINLERRQVAGGIGIRF